MALTMMEMMTDGDDVDCPPPAQKEAHTFGCNDGYDNDFDGLIDADDPECIVSWDDTEGWCLTVVKTAR